MNRSIAPWFSSQVHCATSSPQSHFSIFNQPQRVLDIDVGNGARKHCHQGRTTRRSGLVRTGISELDPPTPALGETRMQGQSEKRTLAIKGEINGLETDWASMGSSRSHWARR